MEDILVKKNEGMPNFPKIEENIIEFWKRKNILEKSINQRDISNSFTFYDGPITSNNKPHYGHALTMVIKDVVPRYKTMKGYHVDRSLGWDCQGIPVEVEVEKALGIDQKSDVEKFGVEKFNQLCRESVLKYQGDISQLTERMGRWVNKDEEYATMDAQYIESVWWSLKELYNKDLLYQGYKVVPYSTGAGTSLSNSEVALGGYKAIVDPAVTVKLKLKNEDTYLLIWTTTPWTLPGNLLVAVGKEFEYVKVEYKGEKYFVAKELADNVFKEKYKIIETVKGSGLVGKEYEPLYPYFEDRRKQGAFTVVHADHVTLEDGTGLVHQAPYGEEDFALMTGMGIEMFDYLDDDGNMKEEITQFKGMFYKKANKYIMQDLEERNLLFAHEDHEHQMPICWRTDTPLIYRPIKSWYVRVSELRKKMVVENNEINWIPEHIKEGRFGNWLTDARDWALSRSRYWGTPLPVWVCDKCGDTEVLGSFKEVEEKSGVRLTDPHKPFVDEVTYKCKCGGVMRRVGDVIDVWYDSGSMPFARFHYPFENQEKFKSKYPAQFIAEGVDQTRGWFYTLHVLGTALFNEKSFQNVIVNGLALAADGTKMSKSKRNYTEVNEVLNQYGADAMRLYFLSSPIVHGEEVIFDPKYLKEVTTAIILPYWNSVKYYLNYARNFEEKEIYNSTNVMDRWILARLTETQKSVNEYMDNYLLQQATNEISSLIDDLSKWYIRSSRDRFVNGDNDALSVLKYVLLELTKLLSPFAPFVTESVYLTLTDGKLKESVHLEDYPQPNMELLDVELISNMSTARKICSLGLNIRDEKRIKVRQPLSKAFVPISDPSMQEIIKNELNVKTIEYTDRVENKIKFGLEGTDSFVSYCIPNDHTIFVVLDINITEELKEEGLFNEIQRGLQVARKENGCKVGEYISIKYYSKSNEINKLVEDHKTELKKVVFIKDIEKGTKLEEPNKIKVGEEELLIQIIK